jgi:magnesium transporter
MNVNIPKDPAGYRVFGIVLSIAIIALFIYAIVVRYWWKQAGKRRRAML